MLTDYGLNEDEEYNIVHHGHKPAVLLKKKESLDITINATLNKLVEKKRQTTKIMRNSR